MPATMQDATKAVWAACSDIVGNEGAALDENASFFDMGLDSLGLAELVVQLEELSATASSPSTMSWPTRSCARSPPS